MIVRLVELPISGTPDECLERFTEAALTEPLPDIALLPELFTTGYALDRLPALALSEEELRRHPLAGVASDNGIWMAAGSFAVKSGGRLLNRFPVFSPEGELVWFTDKVHLFGQMQEDLAFTGGFSGGVFDLEGTTAGGMICYDLRFPELSRALTLMGARLLLVPAEWPEPRQELFRALIRSRAAEAQIFVAGCNLGGEHLGLRFGGGGTVAHPSGRLIEWREVALGVRDFEMDLREVDEVRRTIDCLADRRPDAYDI